MNRDCGFLVCVTALFLSMSLIVPAALVGQGQPSTDMPSAWITATLAKDMHVKRVKVGDVIQAKTMTAIVLKDGTRLKDGARLVGHITLINVKPDGKTPSQIGVLFDKIMQKDDQVPVTLALVGIAPPLPQPGVNPLAANSGMNSWGRQATLASGTGRGAPSESPEDNLRHGLGKTTEKPEDLQAGFSQVDGITLANFAEKGNGTLIECKKSHVYLDAGTRFLFQVK